MRLFILQDDTLKAEMGEWLKVSCREPYGLTLNRQLQKVQVALTDEQDAATFRLAFNDHIIEIANL